MESDHVPPSPGVRPFALRTRQGLGLALALGALCCNAQQSQPTYSIALRIHADADRPLAGATAAFDGKVYGPSNDVGEIPITLSGSEGRVVDLRISCPEGYRPPAAPVAVVLKRISESDRRPEYAAFCQPLQRTLVVAVRAENGPNLPVLYLGREVARTDQTGAAHFLVKTPAEESIELTLDTSRSPELRPRSPNARLQAAHQDDLLVLDQSFSVTARPKAPRPRRSGIINLRER